MERATRKEVIERLKLEREILSKGGYGRSVRTRWIQPQYFRDSVTCLNYGDPVRLHPCGECFLSDYVPAHGQAETIPCHHIPLNERGDTIYSLEDGKGGERVEGALGEWLDAMIARLESEETTAAG